MGDQFTLVETGRQSNQEEFVPTIYGNFLDGWKQEITEYYGQMKRMVDMDPTAVFQHLSQFSARASEIRSQIGPQEGKREAAFRIRIVDPFIEECDRQFKIHSRIQAIREMDARLAGGNFA